MSVLTKKQLSAKVTSIAGRAKTLRNDTHVVLCNIAGRVYQDGDWTQLPRLLSALKGHDQKAILNWVRDNAFVRWTEKDGVITFAVNANAKKQADFDNGDAVVEYLLEQAPWYDAAQTTADAARELNFATRGASFIKAVTKARSENRLTHASSAEIREFIKELENVLKPQAVVDSENASFTTEDEEMVAEIEEYQDECAELDAVANA